MRRASRHFSHATPASVLAPRYHGIPTFMRAPLVSPDSPGAGGVCMFGVPFDGGVTNRPGTRHGPREVRNASSQMRTIHPTHRVNPFELCPLSDAGDVPFSEPYVTRTCHDETQARPAACHSPRGTVCWRI